MLRSLHRILTLTGMLLVLSAQGKAQLHCGNVELTPNTPLSALFSFDEFRDYQAGIVLSNVATLRVSVQDLVVPDPSCSWHLTVLVDNNPAAGTPGTEWEELSPYGMGSGNNPTIDALEIRVRNNCQTSPSNGIFRPFANNGDVLDIIAPLLPVTAGGSCTANVNGPGSYLTQPGEYSFAVDLRVTPGFAFDPGIYLLSLRFHLEENP
jgi:hypothetical protein